jgi:general secretion pathway protein L
MLIELATWWKEQMRDLVPASLRPAGRASRGVVVTVCDDSDPRVLRLTLHTRRRRTDLGNHELGGPTLRGAVARIPKRLRRSAMLQMSPDLLLERTVVLPLAAERDLHRLVAFEMDRLTPFTAEQVLWTCAIESREPARNRLLVRVTIVLRTQVDSILACLTGSGLVPTRIGVAFAGDRARVIPLGAGLPRRALLGPRAGAVAMAGCAALALVATGLPFLMQSISAGALEAKIEAMRSQVAEADRLRTAIAGGVVAADAIRSARDQVGVPLQTLAAITAALPDDTFLLSLG